MVFAELRYPEHYSDVHDRLLAFMCQHFSKVEAGHQGDSYIWIQDGEEKVAIDTFSSMKHQVKSPKPGPHVDKVIKALQLRFNVDVYSAPELEGHEPET